MPTTDSRISLDLIFSAYTYEKDGKSHSAALDPETATVRVFAGSAARSHDLTGHFARTTAKSQGEIAGLVDAALSSLDAAPRASGLRVFTFLPTSRCNMGCAYCGQRHVKENVSPEVAARFLDRVQAAFLSPDVRHVHVAWFGGEPLLVYASIMRMSSRIVEMADLAGRQFSSKMTTNGSLLTRERMHRLIEDARVSRFDITIDGPAPIHDQHRPLLVGGGSFARILETLSWYRDAALQRPAVVVLRTNVDNKNVDHVSEYLHTMKRLGFDDHRKFLFELAPIHSWGNDVSSLALTTQEAARREVEWMQLMEDLGLPFGLLPGRPQGTTCVATDPSSEVIDSGGNLFSCTETPLTAEAGADFLGNLASVASGAVRPRGQFDGWDEAVANGRLPCSTCQLRPLCRGACPKQWTEGSVPCPTLKLNFDDRVAMFMRRHGYAAVDPAEALAGSLSVVGG